MSFKEDMKANNERFKRDVKASNKKFKKDVKGIGKPESFEKDNPSKWRAVPKWQIITLLVIFFPIGLYLLWRQDRWSKNTKKKGTWATLVAIIALVATSVIFAPPSVSVTSSLDAVKTDSYNLTGKIYPSNSQVTVNGVQAKVTGDTFTDNIKLKEGDNNLTVAVSSGSKHVVKVFKIHRYTKVEIAAQEKAAAQKKADDAAAKAKADADAKAKQQQTADAKVKADADAATAAAKKKTDADAAAKAKADADAAAKAAASVTVSQRNAVNKAKQYLSFEAFSHDGLVSQLEYEQFSPADATYGADNSNGDWNAQAAKKAQEYLANQSFSRQGLIDQLEYEKFTPDQAVYGVNSVGL